MGDVLMNERNSHGVSVESASAERFVTQLCVVSQKHM